MKIGIITLLGNNYGNRLQNYAVQELLKQYGKEVYTIKYEKKVSEKNQKKVTDIIKKIRPYYISEVIKSRLMNIYHLNNMERNSLKNLIYFMLHKNEIKQSIQSRNKEFMQFDEKYIVYEKEKLHINGDDKKAWISSYDYFVSGSDQIWNPTYPTATRIAFLQFAPKKKRIALSASFGVSDVSEMETEYREWINEIPYLSVREQNGAEIIKNLTGRKAAVFLDPTMLLHKKYWNEMAQKTEVYLPKQYALCYFLGRKEHQYNKYIDEYITTRSLDKVELLNSEFTEYFSFGPDKMICAIKNADIVFTDSFHGVVFSIIFKKQFVLFQRSEEGKSMNERLETLLKKFGLKDRVFDINNVNRLDDRIDYSFSDEIIEKERKTVDLFMRQALNIG